MNATFVMFASTVLLASSFVLANRVRTAKRLSADLRQTLGDACGVLLAFSLLVLTESTLQRTMGTSFYELWTQNSLVPLQFFAVGAMQGIVYEYVGQFTFPL